MRHGVTRTETDDSEKPGPPKQSRPVMASRGAELLGRLETGVASPIVRNHKAIDIASLQDWQVRKSPQEIANMAAYHQTGASSQDHAEISASGAFARYGECLLELGYGPIPEVLRIPCFKGWTDYYPEKPRTPADISGLIALYPNAELAVACGFNGLLPIDIDTDDEDIQGAILDVLPTCRVRKRGQKGLTLFFRYAGKGISSRQHFLKGEDPAKKGLIFCEVLWIGRKTTIPPTTHVKTGKPYEWGNPRHTLFNIPIEDLPEITDTHLEVLEAATKPWLYERPPRPTDELGRKPLGREPTGVESKRYARYANEALAGRANELAATGEGSRNKTLFDTVCALGKWVHHGFLTKDELTGALMAACKTNGYRKDEGCHAVLETIRSGLFTSRNDALPQLEDRPRGGLNGSELPDERAQRRGQIGAASSGGKADAGPSVGDRPPAAREAASSGAGISGRRIGPDLG